MRILWILHRGHRVCLKNGLCLEGIERKVKYLNGEMHDRLHYAILKEDYYKKFRERYCTWWSQGMMKRM